MVAAVAALVGGAAWLGRTESRLRATRMAEACRGMGLAFHARGTVEELRELADLPLLRRGGLPRVRNLMLGRFRGRHVVFFDYRYTEDAGDDSFTYRQSVALFPGTTLPDFTLEPKSLAARIASALGAPAIEFDAAPGFSQAYRLWGPDETAIRRAFGAAALAFFGTEHHWRVEARDGTAGVWCHDRRCKPHEAELCLTELVAVMDALAPA